ncbi:MAG TPA: TIGR03960 family B12-binding radical SAM protein [Clostridia bacterium]|jgi:radical SAM family uncharacterized protein|nr:TIGR03960 family B12-binding radical SAM protein [Clostridia bacterium]
MKILENKEVYDDTIKHILEHVEKPARYVGGEFGIPKFDKKNPLKTCLVFPDIYEIGMSNLGIKILYEVLNNKDDVICERCFAPWLDMGAELKKHSIELFSLETKTPLKEFDFLGFSLQYELIYTNILYMLELSKIPFLATERGDEYPVLIAGGPCSVNPEPYADFFDIISLGEGEDTISQIADVCIVNRGNKKAIIEECSKIPGVYVPSIHLERMKGKKLVVKPVVKDLDIAPYPLSPIVPNLSVIHDRPVLELYRGCFSNCRFCQASFFYRPVRIKKPETLLKQAEALIKNTGCEELSLSSLSTGDYPFLEPFLKELIVLAENNKIQLQVPSLRLDSLSQELISHTRKTSSLTFAPEAGTQRLRNVINKNITDEDIENTMKIAFNMGYRSVKLYFMIGLPTETDEDLLGIVEIIKRVKNLYFEFTKRRDINIHVSTAVFVPKPLTPFQWAGQISMREMKRRGQFLREEIKNIKGVKFNWSDERSSFLEAVFARGDKNLSKVIIKAYENGAKFDSWTDQMNFEAWEKSFKQCDINPMNYTKEIGYQELLPWEFIDFGVSDNYLKSEYEKSKLGITTEGCKRKCSGCGANKLAKCSVENN